MNILHKELASGRWYQFSLLEQMANIGTEVGRTINWRVKNINDSKMALERGLELLDLTIVDPKNKKRKILKQERIFKRTYQRKN